MVTFEGPPGVMATGHEPGLLEIEGRSTLSAHARAQGKKLSVAQATRAMAVAKTSEGFIRTISVESSLTPHVLSAQWLTGIDFATSLHRITG